AARGNGLRDHARRGAEAVKEFVGERGVLGELVDRLILHGRLYDPVIPFLVHRFDVGVLRVLGCCESNTGLTSCAIQQREKTIALTNESFEEGPVMRLWPGRRVGRRGSQRRRWLRFASTHSLPF